MSISLKAVLDQANFKEYEILEFIKNLFDHNDAVYLVQEHLSHFVSEQKVRKASRRFRDAVLDDRISLAVVFR